MKAKTNPPYLYTINLLLVSLQQRFNTMPTSIGSLEPPLGNTRLQIARLVSALVLTNTHSVNVELANLGTIGVLFVSILTGLQCHLALQIYILHMQKQILLYSNKYFSIQSFIKNRAIYSCILLLVSIVFIKFGKNIGAFRMSFILH